MSMLTPEQRKRLAERWREIVRTTETKAMEWPKIARGLRELADQIERGALPNDRET